MSDQQEKSKSPIVAALEEHFKSTARPVHPPRVPLGTCVHCGNYPCMCAVNDVG